MAAYELHGHAILLFGQIPIPETLGRLSNDLPIQQGIRNLLNSSIVQTQKKSVGTLTLLPKH